MLRSHGIPATVRMRRGIDIQAGCGQLATQAAS
jgi:23S rRNA (adenine2503-C2)-methyltransferase